MRVSSRIIKSDEVEWYVRYILTISKIFFWLSVTLNSTEEGEIAKGKQNQNKKNRTIQGKKCEVLLIWYLGFNNSSQKFAPTLYISSYTMPYAN